MLFSCKNTHNLYSLDKEILYWSELSEGLQNEFLSRKRGSIYDMENKNEIEIHDSSIIGIYRGRKSFIINGSKYDLKWNGNKEILPFIKKNSYLYVMVGAGGGPMHRSHNTLSEYEFYRFELIKAEK